MLFLRAFKVALSALAANKLRSTLAVLGIVIGVSAVIMMIAMGKGAQAKIEEHGKAVAQYLAALRREDSDRNRALAEAAELYLVDAQAMLRNQANAVQARGTSAASRRALVAHISHAGGRGAGWIDQALALKGRTERYYFEYRTAMGAFAELLKAHRDTQDKVRAALPAAPLLEAAVVDGAYQRARQAEEQAAAELERIRQMVVPR